MSVNRKVLIGALLGVGLTVAYQNLRKTMKDEEVIKAMLAGIKKVKTKGNK